MMMGRNQDAAGERHPRLRSKLTTGYRDGPSEVAKIKVDPEKLRSRVFARLSELEAVGMAVVHPAVLL